MQNFTEGMYSPANEKEFTHWPLPSHGHEDVADGHAFTKTSHHSGLGQMCPQPLQQTVKALLSSIAPDFACRQTLVISSMQRYEMRSCI